MKKEQQIYCEIKSPNKRVKLEFDVSPDWMPQTSACWAECPFSVCTFLGETCRALKNKDTKINKYLLYCLQKRKFSADFIC